ncbi:O-antigen translocase [Niabella beijingensis]|uniref:O-antigen translocase n=1 Tax=Niabella beijingensis TaxID=2872700 RepID=UPI001CBF6A87|nr:O-antigen translocase [Niabella beijingensis]MBZ4189997.1 O-antigen translocase [Niabella beijingensis]
MKLIKTSLFTSVSQSIGILGGLVSVKVITSQVGPQGMAYTGQFINATALLSLFAGGAMSTGVVKYLAEYTGDRQRQQTVIQTAFWITIICSLGTGAAVLFFAPSLSASTFRTPEYGVAYIFWALLLVFTNLSVLMSSILNGIKQIRFLTLANILGTVAGVGITILFAKKYQVLGVLIAPSVTAVLLFLVHLYFLNRHRWFSLGEILKFQLNRTMVKLLLSFTLMVTVSGFLTPYIQLFIRNKIIGELGFSDAGYWQAVTRISDYYLGFVIAVLSVYYLPRLSEAKGREELRAEIWTGYKVILPAVMIMALVIWLCRFFIIRVLMTEDFLPAARLFGAQFIADIFKIGSWLLAYLMVAKTMKYTFMLTEIIFTVCYGGLSIVLIKQFGLPGVVYAFLITYLLYWILMYVLMRKYKYL